MAKEGEISMYDKINDHEERIIILEKSDVEILKRMEKVENNYTQLENSIWKTSQSTQDLFRETMKNQWELIKSKEEGKKSDNQMKHELAKTKLEKYSEVIIKVAGAGGILVILAQLLFGS